jgi:hypothetical protein
LIPERSLTTSGPLKTASAGLNYLLNPGAAFMLEPLSTQPCPRMLWALGSRPSSKSPSPTPFLCACAHCVCVCSRTRTRACCVCVRLSDTAVSLSQLYFHSIALAHANAHCHAPACPFSLYRTAQPLTQRLLFWEASTATQVRPCLLTTQQYRRQKQCLPHAHSSFETLLLNERLILVQFCNQFKRMHEH